MKARTKLLLALLVMMIAMLPMAASAASQTVTTWAELKAALADSSVDTIVLGADLEATEKLTVSRAVTIDGNGYSIKRVSSYKGIMLTISADVEMTDLTIDGQNNWTFDKAAADATLADPSHRSPDGSYLTPEAGAPSTAMNGSNKALIQISAGTTTTDGLTVKNTYSSDSSSLFAVYGTGSLDLTGATIQHVASKHEATVVLINSADATVTIDDGTTITDVYGLRNGVVSRINNGTLYMKGGTISDVKGVNSNGSVFMVYKGTLEMSGGTISDTTAYPGPNNSNGSTIYIHSSGNMIMTGGTITDNVGNASGGIIMLGSASNLEISGGEVIGNSAISPSRQNNGDLLIVDSRLATLTGGTFSHNPGEDSVPEGYVVYDNGDGTWTVMPEDQVPVEEPEEEPDEDTAPEENEAPVTGDSTPIVMLVCLMVICGAVMFVLSRKVRA